MDTQEYLIQCIQEEAAEVIKEASKINRFGYLDTAPNDVTCNLLKLQQELAELVAVYEMYHDEIGYSGYISSTAVLEKKKKVKEWMEYSKAAGRLL